MVLVDTALDTSQISLATWLGKVELRAAKCIAPNQKKKKITNEDHAYSIHVFVLNTRHVTMVIENWRGSDPVSGVF